MSMKRGHVWYVRMQCWLLGGSWAALGHLAHVEEECAVPAQNFNTTRHDYEIMMEQGSVLERVDEDVAIPRMQYAVRCCLPACLSHDCSGHDV